MIESDAATGEKVRVDRANAARLTQEAYCFYQPAAARAGREGRAAAHGAQPGPFGLRDDRGGDVGRDVVGHASACGEQSDFRTGGG